MDIKELRIGNWILFDAYGESNYQVSKESFNEIEEHHYSGIPITEEWLIKFGFVKNLKHGIENYINCDFTYYPSNNQVKIFDRFGGSIYVENIEYIHQLQNLCFVLTQKEL